MRHKSAKAGARGSVLLPNHGRKARSQRSPPTTPNHGVLWGLLSRSSPSHSQRRVQVSPRLQVSPRFVCSLRVAAVLEAPSGAPTSRGWRSKGTASERSPTRYRRLGALGRLGLIRLTPAFTQYARWESGSARRARHRSWTSERPVPAAGEYTFA